MTAKTHSRKALNTGILCISILWGFIGIANGVFIVNSDSKSNAAPPRGFSPGKFPNSGSLCGHITDAQTGQPVINATVRVQSAFTGQTDANGYYLIENLPAGRNLTISIESNEYIGITYSQSMQYVNIEKDKQTVKDFKLSKAAMIQLQVVDEANQPIEGAELSVKPFDNLLMSYYLQDRQKCYAATNKEGIALLGGIIPSRMGYLIVATHNATSESAAKDEKQQDYAPGKLIAILNSTEFLESGRIVLQKGEDVKGQAVYEDGAPATDLTISASRSYRYGNMGRSFFHGSSHVDAEGNFILKHIVPDSYYISATKPVEKGTSVTVTTVSTNLPLDDKNELTIKIPLQASQSLVSIRGKLHFTNSIPYSVFISASPVKGGQAGDTNWYKNGKDPCDMNFVIDRLVPGKYTLSFSSSYIKYKTLENIDAPSENLDIELETYERFLISGTVINSQTGEPVQSFKVCIKQVKSLSGTHISQQVDNWEDMNYKDGSFCKEAIGAGTYQVEIAADGFAQTTSEEIDTNQIAPIVVKLSHGGTIKGIVVNDAGQPVDGVKVVPISKIREITPRTGMSFSEQDAAVTVNGVFELNNIAEGIESVKAFYADYPPSIVDNIEVKEGQTTEGVKIVLSKGATVEGYVYDAAGQPQAGIILIFQKSQGYNWMEERSGQLATVTTDSIGYYRSEGLPEQICYVYPQRERDAGGVISRAFVPARGKVSRYDFGGQPVVKGSVVFDGKPLADYMINLTTIQKSNSAIFQCYAKTGADGEFTFGGVPKGKWAIYCTDPENKSKAITLATIETSGEDMDTGVIPKPNSLSNLSVSVEYEQSDAKWDVTDVYLQYEYVFAGQPVVILDRPASNNEPFITKNLVPGRYRLVVNRGYITQQQPIDVTAGNMNVTVRIPKSTASIQCHLTGYNNWGVIWKDSKDVVCYIKLDANDCCEFNNIAAGKYHLSRDCLMDPITLFDFDLSEGEHKVLNINTASIEKRRTDLQVFVLDEYGIPQSNADIRLEGNQTTVEPFYPGSPSYCFIAEPGKYKLYVKCAGYKEIIQSAEVKNWDSQTMKRPPEPVFIRLEK